MTGPLFDLDLATLRRRRAERNGADYFLHERAFDDILERLELANRRFASAVLFGHAGDDWAGRLRRIGVDRVALVDPSVPSPLPLSIDLCVSIGALDTAEPLPAVLAAINAVMAPDGLLIGALAGGNSLPTLRAAMHAADGDGPAAAHVHPRIDPPSLAALLVGAGFVMPVVDVDKVELRYDGLDDLVCDLRAMAATNRLVERPRRPLLRAARTRAREEFSRFAEAGRTTEVIEILHFAAWTAAADKVVD